MEVYIKGMKIPKSCYECWALDDDYDYPMCRITQEQRGYNFDTKGRKMAKCPLINVPESHGRLIDADTLKDKCYITINGTTIGRNNYVMFHEIDDAPTIDAVEVVRCKDCSHAEDDITHMFCVYFHHKVYEDDYCSNAVERRKENEVEE